MSKNYDLLIKDAKVVDGTGNAWFLADVAVAGGRIAGIGKLGSVEADRVIDAMGLIVCPGFIDIHAHGIEQLLVTPRAEAKIMQGITTMVGGNCGSSVAPVKGRLRDFSNSPGLLGGVAPDWSTFKEFYSRLEERGMAINAASLVGNGTVRACLLGLENKKPTVDRLEEMKSLVAEAMEHGAIGLSTGLAYPPSGFAGTEEIVELARVAAKYGGIYATHVRGMAHPIFEAVEEAIEIGEKAGLPVQLSHVNLGPPTWGRVPELMKRVEEARTRGLDVTADTLVHNESVFGRGSLLPNWASEGGLERLLERLSDPETREKIKKDTRLYGDSRGGSVASCLMQNGDWDKLWVTFPKRLLGKTLAKVAEIRGLKDPYDALLDLILEEKGNVRGVTEPYFQEDVDYTVGHPLCMPETDGRPIAPSGDPALPPMHHRTYGAFAKMLGWYVRDRDIITLEEAIRKSTSFPAQRIGLKDRGLLREGMWADITILDPETIRETGTLENPAQYPEGILYVLVNGQIVIDKGEHTGALPGRVLRHCS